MRHLILILVSTLVLSGCGSYIDFRVISRPETNSGRPFRMVVRAIDYQKYITENYQEVAKTVYDDPESTVLKTETIYPGEDLSFEVVKPEESPVAVYFLFTQPGNRWKSFLVQPLPSDIQFRLERREILGQEVD